MNVELLIELSLKLAICAGASRVAGLRQRFETTT